jgi:uncharacterized peroxidase-related enzyme
LLYDYRQADFDTADRALCDYAVKLTLAPGDVTEDDIETLRGHGFDDTAITIAVQVISYFNYINRVADGLGVDDEAGFTPSREQWHQRRGRDYVAT